MNKTVITMLGAFGLVLLSTSTSLAAGLALTNGGLGQVAANPQQFGVAVCAGNAALTKSVPVTVSTNGENATIASAASIATGSCQYTYLPYSELDMQVGQTYTVSVTIDPQHTVSSNTNNQTTYTVTVPQPTVATVPSKDLTADATAQSSNIFVAFWNWLGNLFHSL